MLDGFTCWPPPSKFSTLSLSLPPSSLRVLASLTSASAIFGRKSFTYLLLLIRNYDVKEMFLTESRRGERPIAVMAGFPAEAPTANFFRRFSAKILRISEDFFQKFCVKFNVKKRVITTFSTKKHVNATFATKKMRNCSINRFTTQIIASVKGKA